MIANGTGALLGAFAFSLIFVISCEPLEATDGNIISPESEPECDDQFYLELHTEGRSIDEIEAVLLSVNQEDWHRVMIGQISVAQLMAFKNTSCELEEVADRNLNYASSTCCCGRLKSNSGAIRFRNFYWHQYEKSCEAKFVPILSESLGKISDQSKGTVARLYDEWQRGARNSAGEFHYSVSDKSKEQNKRFLSCLELISTLPNQELLRPDLNVDFITMWHNIMGTCKMFVRIRCSKLLVNEISMFKLSPSLQGEILMQMSQCVQIGVKPRLTIRPRL